MKNINFSEFKFWCSELSNLYSLPRGFNKPSKREMAKYDKIVSSTDEKSEEDRLFLEMIDNKMLARYDHPISKSTQSFLIRLYGKSVFCKKTAAKGNMFSFLEKGLDMELEAIELMSKIDKTKYERQSDFAENDYITGKCDILSISKNKIIDTKISWDVNSFLKARIDSVSKKHWYQVQGYMELYNIDKAEVAFVLLNTPPELIERERVKLTNKVMVGEISMEKYELDMSNLDLAYTYNNIPAKNRVFRYVVKREPEIFPFLYKKIEKSRIWLEEFHNNMKNNLFVVSSQKYLEVEKNNTEPDPADTD